MPTSLPPYLISLNLLICEKALREVDSVVSVVRLVDIFYVASDVPLERQGVPMFVVITGKWNPDPQHQQQVNQHSVQLRLIRPDGEKKAVGEPLMVETVPENPKFPGAPVGFNIVFRINVLAKQLGTHYLVALFDGEEAARAPVTLVQRAVEEVD